MCYEKEGEKKREKKEGRQGKLSTEQERGNIDEES